MPYYKYCRLCNLDGSYSSVKEDCGMCCGTGNDWHEDYELEYEIKTYDWTNISLEWLKNVKTTTTNDGTKLFYQEQLPTSKEIQEQKKALQSDVNNGNTALLEDYEYYVEPCQWCISNDGSTYDYCGWCRDDEDTFYKMKDGKYVGNYVKIPYGGYGYPFHQLPHAEREYYKNGQLITNSQGKTSSDVSDKDIQAALESNESVKEMLEDYKSGGASCLFGSNYPIKKRSKEELTDFIDKYQSINSSLNMSKYEDNIDSSIEIDKYGKYKANIDFATLKINFGLNEDDVAYMTESQRGFVTHFEKSKFEETDMLTIEDFLKEFPEYEKFFFFQELFFHESFHMLQILLLQSCRNTYEKFRGLEFLRAMICSEVIREGKKFHLDKVIFSSLNEIENEDLQRFFALYKQNPVIIANFFNNTSNLTFSTKDIVEGQAYVFQKMMSRTIDLNLFSAKEDSTYRKAYNHFRSYGGEEELEFYMLSHISLKYGLIGDDKNMKVFPTAPELFDILCKNIDKYNLKMNQDMPSNQLGRDIMDAFNNTIHHIEQLKKYDCNLEMDSIVLNELLSKMDNEKLFMFSEMIHLYDRAELCIADYFKDRKITFRKNEKIDYSDLSDNKISKIGQLVEERFDFFQTKYFVALLVIDYTFAMELVTKHLTEISNNMSFTGFWGKETDVEMDDFLSDILNRFDNFLQGKLYCCSTHGRVGDREKIIECTEEDGLSNLIRLMMHKNIEDLI